MTSSNSFPPPSQKKYPPTSPNFQEAFSIVMKTDLVDELIVLNNDEDDLLTDEERWGRFQKRIEEDSRWRAEFMDW